MSLEAMRVCEQDAKGDFVTIWKQKQAQLSRAYRSNTTFDPVLHWAADVHEQQMHAFNSDFQANQEQNT